MPETQCSVCLHSLTLSHIHLSTISLLCNFLIHPNNPKTKVICVHVQSRDLPASALKAEGRNDRSLRESRGGGVVVEQQELEHSKRPHIRYLHAHIYHTMHIHIHVHIHMHFAQSIDSRGVFRCLSTLDSEPKRVTAGSIVAKPARGDYIIIFK